MYCVKLPHYKRNISMVQKTYKLLKSDASFSAGLVITK